MSQATLLDGTIHKLPKDLELALRSSAVASSTWNNITPLARTEWICLVISPKHAATRIRRIKRAIDQLTKGQRRPCCWEGCPHREKLSR